MAIVKNSVVLQNASGTLGEFYVRTFRGKKILARKPFKRKTSHSAAALKGRNKFSAAVLISKNINKQPVLKDLWKGIELKGSSPYQKMVSFNAMRADNGLLTASNVITPEGIRLIVNSALVENNILNLEFVLMTEDFITFPAQIFVFLYFMKLRKTMSVLTNIIPAAAPDGKYSMIFEFDENTRKAYKKDVNPLIYVAAVGSTHHKDKEFWSKTAVVQL